MLLNIEQLINLTITFNTSVIIEENKIFDNCEFRFFIDNEAKVDENYLSTRKDWFDFLKWNDCRQIYVGFFNSSESFETVGFANGGFPWIIVAEYKNKFEYWCPFWTLKKDEKTKTLWVINFKPLKINSVFKPVYLINTSIEDQKQKLYNVLEETSRFANQHKYTKQFITTFKNAIERLEGNDQIDFIPTNIPYRSFEKKNRQLLAAATKAFVFGGSGSWNDVGLETQGDYQYITTSLYDTINNSIVVSINNK
jgi:hypothetical protein